MITLITDSHVESAIRDRRDFVTHGSARGYHPKQHPGLPITIGVLPDVWIERYLVAARAGRIDYVITSFETPIAWVTDDGTRVVPLVNYSKTSSRLQNRARSALDDYVETPDA